MKTFWILYCAMQAIPAIEPTPSVTFASQQKCLHQAEVSNSFGELHCVCAEGKADHLSDEGILR